MLKRSNAYQLVVFFVFGYAKYYTHSTHDSQQPFISRKFKCLTPTYSSTELPKACYAV